jgi:5'-nucleotidase
MQILITNDDGINAPGLRRLFDALKEVGKVIVVAPDKNQSAAGHSLTLHKPLRIEKHQRNWYAINGTPTDCVNLAVNSILKKKKPDMLVSGINQGGNLGDDITYSGTVSAAVEGTLLGIPSLAISVDGRGDIDYTAASLFALKLVKTVSEKGMPKNTLLNVNIPNLPIREITGVTITRQGKRIWEDSIVEKVDPRGQKYYWIGGNDRGWRQEDRTDIQAVREGYISITPLHLDMTNYRALEELNSWEIKL